ncbi:RpiB/LacA/LacB family sugar-phosphate isomerase [Candidatus Enterococcus clewellii]|uniref:Ribose 5-phosphate isomerase B n=1 Tax=Candidatus Enterococcus clewellii TaxID=1834193 RepID=A0A242JWV7_9ENTE|nr:RpiB/LacA/LacB family sugar-phosphate isomerase [Enterococcus sp. 9E7_DIV0242]OTP09798.1 hypothetical protein A5888_003994 [Enterococcus sp. 9E7_DIV0242]
MRLGIGNDHKGYYLKKTIGYYLKEQLYDFIDLGTSNGFEVVDYSACVEDICKKIQHEEIDGGILIGGTGIGMSICANKYQNIRAALVQDVFSAKIAKERYDANILCLGEQVCGEGSARMIIDVWLQTAFQGNQQTVL